MSTTRIPNNATGVQLDPWFDLRALAHYSGMGLTTLKAHLADPHHPIPHFRPGGRGGKILVRRSEFDAWMERFRVQRSVEVDREVDAIVSKFSRP